MSEGIDLVLVLLVQLAYLLQEGALLLHPLTVQCLYHTAHLLPLPVPQHLQDLSPVLTGLGYLRHHLAETSCNEGLLILKLASKGVISLVNGLHLSLEPHHKVLNLLLLRQHLLVARFRLLEQTGV